MVYHLAKLFRQACRRCYFLAQVFAHYYLLNIDPFTLSISDKRVTSLSLVFNLVEIVNNYAYEQINDKETANNHERHEVKHAPHIVTLFGLEINATSVNPSIHHNHPAFSSHHLEQNQHCVHNIIKIGH